MNVPPYMNVACAPLVLVKSRTFASVTGTTTGAQAGKPLLLPPPPPLPVAPALPVVPAVPDAPARPVPLSALPSGPGLFSPAPPQFIVVASATGNITKEKRAIALTVLTNTTCSPAIHEVLGPCQLRILAPSREGQELDVVDDDVDHVRRRGVAAPGERPGDSVDLRRVGALARVRGRAPATGQVIPVNHLRGGRAGERDRLGPGRAGAVVLRGGGLAGPAGRVAVGGVKAVDLVARVGDRHRDGRGGRR